MKRAIGFLFLVAITMGLPVLRADASVPTYINYQGILTDGSGDPIDVTTSVVFTIYNAAAAGTTLWTETRSITPDAIGRFSVILGQAVPIADSVFKTPPCWLGTTVAADPELAPRTLLSSVPYTYRVATLDGATGGNVTGDVTILTDGVGGGAGVRDPGGNIGAYTPTAAVFTDSAGDRTVSYGINGITISINNTSPNKDALVDTIFQIDADDTTMVMGTLSRATAQGAIALGDSATVLSDYSTIAGGAKNQIGVDSRRSFIGSGFRNEIGEDFSHSVIAGGEGNLCEGGRGAIGGGQNNTVSNEYGTVPGGFANTAGQFSFAAGRSAKATNSGTFVWGDNSSDDFASTANNQFLVRASGGVGIGTSRTPSQMNVFAGSNAVQTTFTQSISSAGLNIATSYTDGNFVPGVFWSTENVNLGKPKAGIYARMSSSGSEIWFGTSNLYTTGITNSAMIIDEDGDVGLGLINPTNPLHLVSGARCTAGGVWTNASDASRKENFKPIDGEDMLEKLDRLPITQWNYRNEDPSITHIGPTAQDFLAAFGVGGDDKSISTIDPSGIALAAIKELNQQNQSLNRETAELRLMIKSLQQQLNDLKQSNAR